MDAELGQASGVVLHAEARAALGTQRGPKALFPGTPTAIGPEDFVPIWTPPGGSGSTPGLPPFLEHPDSNSPTCYLSGMCDGMPGVPDSAPNSPGGNAIGEFGSVTFSIALSFGGSLW